MAMSQKTDICIIPLKTIFHPSYGMEESKHLPPLFFL